MINKFKKFSDLVQGIINYNLLRYFRPLPPTEMQINVTYRCNSRCQMCHIWKMKPKNELSLKEWQKIMRDPIFLGIKRLNLSGGEPILHPDLEKLVRLFLNSMPKLENLDLTTNGFLTNKTLKMVKSLALLAQRKGIKFSVSVSLDGIGKMHETIRRVPQAFEKASATILALRLIKEKYNFRLGVAGVVFRKNLHQIREVEDWCKGHDTPFCYQIIGFHETYVQNMGEKGRLDFRKADEQYLLNLLQELTLKRSLKDLHSFLRSYYWNDMVSMHQGGLRTTPCPFVLDAFVLDSLGDVYYCLSERKIGNCREGKAVSEIYYDPKNLAFRKQIAKTVCLKCNSGCFVTSGIAKDFKKFAWFFLTGKRGPVGVY